MKNRILPFFLGTLVVFSILELVPKAYKALTEETPVSLSEAAQKLIKMIENKDNWTHVEKGTFAHKTKKIKIIVYVNKTVDVYFNDINQNSVLLVSDILPIYNASDNLYGLVEEKRKESKRLFLEALD